MKAPLPQPTAPRRFTIDGSDALESRLTETCQHVTEGVRSLIPRRELEALVLGGGYGRGEGGVLRLEAGDLPYNDLEFYVFLRGDPVINDGRFKSQLEALGEALSPPAGLHVEFKITARDKLRAGPVTMFSYDLVSGHRMVHGDEKIFDGFQTHTNPKNIPASEATRLLFNRCTGLLLAEAVFRKPALTPEDVDFIGRNVAKAQLAFGDALLALRGEYHWSVERRRAALQLLEWPQPPEWWPAAREHHTAGADFKLHPARALPKGVNARARQVEVTAFAQLVWLWVEQQRLGKTFASTREYALDAGNKCPDTATFKNALINLRTFGWRGKSASSLSRYPRERLLNTLPLLLWHPQEINAADLRSRLQDQLITIATDWSDLLSAYTALWRKFS